MAPAQHIVVCTEDAVLAKKVRFLLARDECEVEILGSPTKLESRLENGDVSLLILSHTLAGESAPDLVSRLHPAGGIPPTIVLGGQSRNKPAFVSVIDDPSDTQAIYRVASDLLGRAKAAGGLKRSSGLPRPSARNLNQKTQRTSPVPGANGGRSSDADLGDLDDISDRLDAALEGDDTVERDSSQKKPGPTGEDITQFDVARYHAAAPPGSERMYPSDRKAEPSANHLGLKGPLEPGKLGRALFRCWTVEATGALVLERDDETLTIFMEGGFPINVESNITGDLLGKNLVGKGTISEEQYSAAAKLSIERALTIGQSLVDLGHLSGDSLGKEQGEDAHERIIKRFAARDGKFEFETNRAPSTRDRPYRIPIGRILAEGLRRYCQDEALAQVVGQVETEYFRLRDSITEVRQRLPLTETELAFLEYSGRAYNVQDAAELCALSQRQARVLMALLKTCEEVEDFVPGVAEFEARIREERARVSRPPSPSLPELPAARAPALGMPGPSLQATSEAVLPRLNTKQVPQLPPEPFSPPSGSRLPPPIPAEPDRFLGGGFVTMEPQNPSPAVPPPPPPPDSADSAIPPMPEPPMGTPGRVPRAVAFSPPMARSADGQPQETPERTRSRQHFQKGVTLLGQGNFDDAEESFRDAIALCAEEHVYLIGLARAIYYNPAYGSRGKVPVLRSIVDRAGQLAPGDARVHTLDDWVRHAERA